MIGTYQGKWEDGSVSQGGCKFPDLFFLHSSSFFADPPNLADADYTRCRGRFAIPIPDALEDETVAPLLCAGVTTYSPLKRFGAGPGKKVGIIGIGGLGHLALQMSNALGAETYALSHSDSKLADAEKLGVKVSFRSPICSTRTNPPLVHSPRTSSSRRMRRLVLRSGVATSISSSAPPSTTTSPSNRSSSSFSPPKELSSSSVSPSLD